MKYADVLSVNYFTPVFQAEIMASALLVFLVLIFRYLFKVLIRIKIKIICPIFFSASFFLAGVSVWDLSHFLSSTKIPLFITPINVVIQSFFQGVTTSFNQAPLIAGVWYIIGAQFIGALIAGLSFLFVAKFSDAYFSEKKGFNEKKVIFSKIKNFQFSWIKIHSSQFAANLAISLDSNLKTSFLKFNIKEAVFILILVASSPFYEYISRTAFQTNLFWNFMISALMLCFLLVISEHFNFFMFNFNLVIILNLILIIFQPWKLIRIASVAIQSFWTFFWSITVAIILLKISQNNSITFIF